MDKIDKDKRHEALNDELRAITARINALVYKRSRIAQEASEQLEMSLPRNQEPVDD